jgi:hypothetical protein
MTGDVVVSKKTFAEVANRIKIIVDWTSGTGTTEGMVISDPIDTIGFVYEYEMIPGALGVPATNPPANSYNLWIKDPYGYDLIIPENKGSSTVAQRELSEFPMWVDDYMTLYITAAGSGTQGRLIIWIDRTTP